MRKRLLPFTVLVPLALLVAAGVQARELTFEERVDAQAALERVYHAHQIGVTRPFEQAVPRAVLEAKVRNYLKQSAALEALWNTPVTVEMLQAEMERQARQTRMPERLSELYAALDDDPFLVRECLARPALVDRLTRNFHAFDGRFHAAARAEAEELRQALVRYGIGAFASDPRRSEIEIVRADSEARPIEAAPQPDGARRFEIPSEEFARWRAQAPRQPGEIGPLREERDSFVILVVLEEGATTARIASFTVEKRRWDPWWEKAAGALDAASVGPVDGDGPLPVPSSGGPQQPGADDQASQPDSSPEAPCLPDDTWDNGSLNSPGPRAFHSAVWAGNRLIVWGGASDFVTPLDTGGRYDAATDTWMLTSTVGAPSPRTGHTVVWTGSLMVVWGGYDNSYLNTGARYDPATDSWTPTSSVGAPSARQSHTAVWAGSLMIVWGGFDGAANSSVNTGARYDPATDSWTPTSTVGAPTHRDFHTAVWTGSSMVVWGGYSSPVYLHTGGRYDPEADSWTPTSIVGAPAPRFGHTAVWTGSLMVVWGGTEAGSFLNTGGRYDPAADAWNPTSIADAPGARWHHTAVWTGNLMVAWGGQDNDSNLDSGGRYDPATDTWTPTSTAGAPSPRDFHTAVWTGSRMVVWGGRGVVYLDTGGRYDPVSDSWTPIATPSARTLHTTVWTGSLMVVWGGFDGSFLNTGDRYDPATDSWTPTSTEAAPSARREHTAVWTGDLMLVWGGDGGSSLSTGGRYDPATDSWMPISTVGAPSARDLHAAVWTGSLMLVWGGFGGAYLDTGGRYDPATDGWTPISTVGAPSARRKHTALWTGQVMVVWGGYGGSYLNSGGRYDPATNSWTPTAIVGAPSARRDHTALWTGEQMLVWGGFGGSYVNTGGRYDPATGSWLPTSTVGAPSARSTQTAVWTGHAMVVWGGLGISGGPYLGTGGRYSPATDSWSSMSTVGAPSARTGQTAVWTGSLMIVWGGYGGSYLNSGGRYALGQSTDDDGDGSSECDGDCNDADAGVFAIPAEVTGLRFAVDGVTLEWNSAAPGAGSATVHDALAGALGELPIGSGASETCVDTTAASSIVVPEVPPSGSGYWYLVRGSNLCGDGTYGNASDGTPRASAVCP